MDSRAKTCKLDLVVGSLLFTIALGCHNGNSTAPTASGGSADGKANNHRETIGIPVKFNAATGLNLTNPSASAFTISLANCASGFAPSNATQASPALQAYTGDRGCVAKLLSFVANGNTYQLASGATGTWTTNGVSTFANAADATDTMAVTVNSQVSDPIVPSDTVAFTYSALSSGSSQTINNATVSNGHALSVQGQGAPFYKISNVSFSGITAQGAGQFVFTMQCLTALTNTNQNCRDVVQTNLVYALVQDTYNGTLTAAQAQTILSGTPSTVVSGDLNSTGFVTKTLTGPNQMATNPNMLLVFGVNNLSFEYFKVNVAALVQN